MKKRCDLIKLSSVRILAVVERLYGAPIPCGARRDLALESVKGHALIQSQKNFVSCKPLCGKREKMSRNGEMVMKGHVLIKS